MPHEQHAAIKLWVQPMPIHGVAALVVAVGPGYVIIYSTYIYIYIHIYNICTCLIFKATRTPAFIYYMGERCCLIRNSWLTRALATSAPDEPGRFLS